jgi:hypothetical protein
MLSRELETPTGLVATGGAVNENAPAESVVIAIKATVMIENFMFICIGMYLD